MMVKVSKSWALAISLVTCLATQSIAAAYWINTDKPNCAIWSDEASKPNDKVTWSGACKDNKASGFGKLTWFRSGKLHGLYEGRMIGGKFNGPGTLQLAKGSGFTHLEGVFKNGIIDGGALFKDANGNVYEGSIKDGKPNGNGYQKIGSEEYLGEFVDGVRQGVGLLITPKLSYLGEFAKGLPSGSGVMEDDADGRYHGQFRSGKPNGAGTYIEKSGAIYQGRFADGKPNGIFLVQKNATAPAVVETWKDGKKVK